MHALGAFIQYRRAQLFGIKKKPCPQVCLTIEEVITEDPASGSLPGLNTKEECFALRKVWHEHVVVSV